MAYEALALVPTMSACGNALPEQSAGCVLWCCWWWLPHLAGRVLPADYMSSVQIHLCCMALQTRSIRFSNMHWHWGDSTAAAGPVHRMRTCCPLITTLSRPFESSFSIGMFAVAVAVVCGLRRKLKADLRSLASTAEDDKQHCMHAPDQ